MEIAQQATVSAHENYFRLDAADAAEDDQAEVTGEAQRASAVRRQAEATRRADASERTEAGRIAPAGTPQLRKVLGLVERIA